MKLVRTLPEKSAQKDFLYNMLGSMVNAAVSVILLVVVSHLLGARQAGVFSLAYSTAQMIYTIGVFEMRNIQVTDVKKQFSFNALFVFRLVSIAAALAFSAGFILYKGYSGEKALVMVLLIIYFSVQAFTDLLQGDMHLNGYLQTAGKSLTMQVSLCAVVFIIMLAVTKNLTLSIILMVTASLLWMFFYDIPVVRNFNKMKPSFKPSVQKSIFFAAFPLFCSSFMLQYVFNASKYAIDEVLTALEQSSYGYLIMPTSFISLLSIFVFRPQLVPLSENWTSGEKGKFAKKCFLLFGWVAVVLLAALVCGYLLGIPVLELLYSAELGEYRGILLILLTAGGFSAAATLTSTLVTVMRKQKYCMAAYFLTFLLSLFLPKHLVLSYGLRGAAVAYLIEMLVLFALLFVIFIAVLIKAKPEAVQDTE